MSKSKVKYRKVRIAKIMVEHSKMIDGAVTELDSAKVYDTLSCADKAKRQSMENVSRRLNYTARANVWNEDTMTKPSVVAGFNKNGKAEMHWWYCLPVVEEESNDV